jgi:hypothetical protein
VGGQLCFGSGEIDRRNQIVQARTPKEATTQHIQYTCWPIATHWSLRNVPDADAYATCFHCQGHEVRVAT